MVKGIEFWENGIPDRDYKILGVIDHSRMHYGGLGFGTQDKAIAKAAQRQGGDAVIFVGGSSELLRVNPDSGYLTTKRYTRVVLVKYLDMDSPQGS